MTDSHFLFVYGTLMRNAHHPQAQHFHQAASFLGPARWQGRLYLVSYYPGAVPSELTRGHRARGTLDPHKSTSLGITRSVRGMYSPRFAPPRVHTLNRNRLAWRTSARGLGLYLQAGYERIKANYFGSFSWLRLNVTSA